MHFRRNDALWATESEIHTVHVMCSAALGSSNSHAVFHVDYKSNQSILSSEWNFWHFLAYEVHTALSYIYWPIVSTSNRIDDGNCVCAWWWYDRSAINITALHCVHTHRIVNHVCLIHIYIYMLFPFVSCVWAEKRKSNFYICVR